MSDDRVGELHRECDLFARYLVGETASSYVRERYAAAHVRGDLAEAAEPSDRLEARLLEYGRRGGLRLRMADMYARFRRPGALLRRKLVLALAILETAPPTHRPLNSPARGGWLGLMAGVSLKVLASGMLLVAGSVVFAATARHSSGDAPGAAP